MMKIRTLKALTLMELLVTLIVSGILLSIVLLGLNWTGASFQRFSSRNEDKVELRTWMMTLEREISQADSVLVNGSSLKVFSGEEKIDYYSTSDGIVRYNASDVRDTLEITGSAWLSTINRKKNTYTLEGQWHDQMLSWQFVHFHRINP
ncbi:PulJ/GspJ family protein [Sanyastnella coralliicola]|uniref:PulJ/GspJ family protein n=1 Tax=Sanyastnella coralliicola TaxID=3069118 RepID=UPI0027B8ADA9|nr:prepilin-type N-terminal cleavage/methylation domain-containing protein [Longitalea sp. SCSIO 12813]